MIWRACRGIPGPVNASGGNGTGCKCPSAFTWNEYALLCAEKKKTEREIVFINKNKFKIEKHFKGSDKLLTVCRQHRATVIHLFGRESVDRSREVECGRMDRAVVSDRDQLVADMVMMDSPLVMVERRLWVERLVLNLVLSSVLYLLVFQAYRATKARKRNEEKKTSSISKLCQTVNVINSTYILCFEIWRWTWRTWTGSRGRTIVDVI